MYSVCVNVITYHLQLTDYVKQVSSVPKLVNCFFASSNLLIEEGFGKC